jgi:hypothetical protein
MYLLSYCLKSLYKLKYLKILLFPILAEVPQESDFSPDLYNIFASDIPQTQNITLATYADDTSILSSNIDPTEEFTAFQPVLGLI